MHDCDDLKTLDAPTDMTCRAVNAMAELTLQTLDALAEMAFHFLIVITLKPRNARTQTTLTSIHLLAG